MASEHLPLPFLKSAVVYSQITENVLTTRALLGYLAIARQASRSKPRSASQIARISFPGLKAFAQSALERAVR